MKSIVMVSGSLFLFWSTPAAIAQFTVHPYVESFDAVDSVPSGWGLAGFEVSSSASHSAPNCLLARGNHEAHAATSPQVNPAAINIAALEWFERRSSSAAGYSLSVIWLTGPDAFPLATFDSIGEANTYEHRILPLSIEDLFPSATGRFRFEISADGTNSTGVLRIDDVRLVTVPRADLSARMDPPVLSHVFVGEEIPVSIRIRNERTTSADAAELVVGVSADGYSTPLARRIFRLPPLSAGDAVTIDFPFTSAVFGHHSLSAQVRWPLDEVPENDTAHLALTVGYAPGTITVTEFMFAPTTEDEPEWIEIVNTGRSVADLQYLQVSDKGSQRSQASTAPLLAVPGQTAIIAGSSSMTDVYDMRTIPLSISRFPSLNNTTPDAVVIRDMFGTMLDSVAYDPAWGEPGLSLEKRDWNLPAGDRTSWLPTLSSAGGTPGRTNSHQRHEVDASLSDLHGLMEGSFGRMDLSVTVRNAGRLPIAHGTVSFTAAWRPGSPDETVRPVGTGEFVALDPDEARVLLIPWEAPESGDVAVTAVVGAVGDRAPSNDTATAVLSIPYIPGSAVINEIMFDPSPGSCEWIEVLVTGKDVMDLFRWTILDLPTASGQRVRSQILSSPVFHPGELVVLAADSSLFMEYSWLRHPPYRTHVLLLNRSGGLGLNADRDGVVLLDMTGRTIDSVAYEEAWHHPSVETKGRSLERISPSIPGTLRRAWTSAPGVPRASPGKPNAARSAILPEEERLVIHPNPFSPDQDGRDELLYVTYAFSSPTVFVRARLYDDRGRHVRTLSDGGLYAGHDVIMWDGLTDAGRRVRIGPYILLFEAWNAENGFSMSQKRVVVVAR